MMKNIQKIFNKLLNGCTDNMGVNSLEKTRVNLPPSNKIQLNRGYHDPTIDVSHTPGREGG